MNSDIVRRIEWFSIDIDMSNFSNFAVLLESFLVMKSQSIATYRGVCIQTFDDYMI